MLTLKTLLIGQVIAALYILLICFTRPLSRLKVWWADLLVVLIIFSGGVAAVWFSALVMGVVS